MSVFWYILVFTYQKIGVIIKAEGQNSAKTHKNKSLKGEFYEIRNYQGAWKRA